MTAGREIKQTRHVQKPSSREDPSAVHASACWQPDDCAQAAIVGARPGDLEAGEVELRLVEVFVLEVEPGEVLQALLEAGDAVLHQVSYQLKRSLRFNPPSEL